MLNPPKFTVTGANHNGASVFLHAIARNADQLKPALKACYGDEAELTVLEGHCVAIDGTKPQRLDEVAVRIYGSAACTPQDKSLLDGYIDWLKGLPYAD